MTNTADAAIRVVGLVKHFRRESGGRVAAIDSINLDLAKGSMTAVLGPSGCGKTTLLRCIAGLEAPTGGEIWHGSQLLSNETGILVPPEHRFFGMMFQSYAVWPHMSVFDNVAYPLRVQRRSKAETKARVSEMLETVGIAHLSQEFSSRLSGGQQQRITLARCLVNDPDVVLFDEPLSNVDAKVREELCVEIQSMQQRIGFAGLYVTHDQEEALSIADRVVVLNEGKVAQVGTPRKVYDAPTSRFVAGFVGALNEWVGRVAEEQGDILMVETAMGDLSVSRRNVAEGIGQVGETVSVVVRPEFMTVSTERPADSDSISVWEGTTRAQMFRGAHCDYFIDVGSGVLRVRADVDAESETGDSVFVSVPASRLHMLGVA